MSRATLTNVVLALLVAGLAAFLYLRTDPHAKSELTLSALRPDDVTRIRVERGAHSIALEQRDGVWYVAEPYRARADSFRVTQLLGLLTSKSTRRLAATDLDRFDLERPEIKVTFDDQVIGFGTLNTMSNEQYASSGDGVYLVSPRALAAVPTDVRGVTSRDLFATDETPVEIALGATRMLQEEGRWKLTPDTAGLSQDDLNRWAGDWKNAASMITQRAGTGAAAERITVRLGDGRTLQLAIVQREPELVLRRDDEGLQYHFSGEMGKRLLTPPGASIQ